MTTYNTGNPVPSVDVRDLYDNAENLDNLTNGSAFTYADRTGTLRKSWAGMEEDFQQFLLNSGYTGTGPGGAFQDYDTDGPLTITARNQIFTRMGEFYRADAALALPYVTINNWATDQTNFVSVGDAVLRQDLADDVDPLKGAGQVGFSAALAYAAGTVGGALRDLISAAAQGLTLISVREYGVTLDGVTDDTVAFQAAITDARDNLVNLYVPAGDILITSPLVYDTTGLGFYPGLRMFGAGQLSSQFINNINAAGVGGPVLRLTSGASSADQQQGGIVSGLGCVESGSGTDAHFIEYRGTWHQKYENLYADSLTGAGLRCINSAADADSSAHVNISMCRFMSCAGGSWNGNGGSGGISVHTIRDLYATNCGATSGASVIIDGCVHFDMRQCSITGQGAGAPNVPLVHIKNTSIRSRLVSIEGGEYGNNGGTHVLVDAVTILTIDGIRHVRRSGETNSTLGIVFANGSSLHQGVRIEQVELQIDTATPVWTWLSLGTGMAPDFKVVPPNVTAFAAGNVMYATSTSPAHQRISYGTPGNITRDLSVTDWHQINFTASGAYTLLAPVNGTYGGAEMVITVINSVGATLSFSSDYLVTGYVDSVTEKSAVFKYDASSAKWKQMGGWSSAT